jgi:hypothetical protein
LPTFAEDRVVRTNKHPVTTRTRKQWWRPEATQWVETERIEVATTDLERVSRWDMRGFAERMPRNIRRREGLWTGRVVSWCVSSRTT